MTVSDIKSEWIWHHFSLNSIRKNDTGHTGNYAIRYISTYYTFTNGSAAFDTLQLRIPLITVHNIGKHILITFVTVLHINTPQ